MTPISPDCEQGKHTACTGDAWDHDRDAPATCTCSCHQDAYRARRLLEYAALGCLGEDQAVTHAVRLLRRRTVKRPVAVPRRPPAVPAQRRPD